MNYCLPVFASHCSNARRFAVLLILLLIGICSTRAQTAQDVLQQVKAKLDRVNEYEAKGKMRTNVAFIRAPIANVKVYYKRPDKLLIVNETGISFIPKGSVNINMNNVFVTMRNFDIIDAGVDASGLRVIKLLSKEDTSDIVLSTLYIDQKKQLIVRSKTTTKENGTYELEMSYGAYSEFGLPGKIIFSFNTKDYKLPKGITLDYDDGEKKESTKKTKNEKGRVEITFSDYKINKGLPGKIFAK